MTLGNLSRHVKTSRPTMVALLIGLAAVMTLGLTPTLVAPAHATAVTCGQTLDSGAFVLEADLGPCDDPTGPTAVTVNGTADTPASLDLAGFSVICQDLNGKKGVPVGIMVTGASVTITNGKVVGCKNGIQLTGDGSHSVKSVTVDQSTSSGVLIKADSNRINAVTASNGNADGIVVQGSNNTITKSAGTGNAGAGLTVQGGHNHVKANSASGNAGAGYSVGGSHNKVAQNTADSNTGAGVAVTSDHNSASGNTATNNAGGGYSISGNHVQVKGNTATGNTSDGITLIGSANKVSGNTASSNAGNGIAVNITSSLNKLQTNVTDSNGKAGTTVSGLSNLIKGGEATTNTVVDLEDTNPNCDSNKWKGNTFGTASQSCIK